MVLCPLRAALTATGAALIALALNAPPSHADYAGPMEFCSSAVVTRLTLIGGTGHLVVQPQLSSTSHTGFEVDIPAGDGVWTGPADVPVPERGIDCLRQPGSGLTCQCGQGLGGDSYGRNQWSITGSNATRLAVKCSVLTAGPTVHRKPKGPATSLPPGESHLVLDLSRSGDHLPPLSDILGSLDLTNEAGTTWRADSFPWLSNERA